MRLLLDTHIVLALVDENLAGLPKRLRAAIKDEANDLAASVMSLWEVAIKHRQGRLPLPCPLEDLPVALSKLGVDLLDLRPEHVVAMAEPVPDTKDPFDRMLLAICLADELRLVTVDRALIDHPLSYRAS